MVHLAVSVKMSDLDDASEKHQHNANGPQNRQQGKLASLCRCQDHLIKTVA